MNKYRLRTIVTALLATSALTILGTSCGGSAIGDAGAPETLDPRYPEVEVFVNNHRFGDSNGCTSTFSPPLADGTGSEMTCGHPGAVSKLRWKYVHTDREGDHYTFSRRYPSDAPVNTTERKEVVYAGEEVVVFEDDAQRILLRPVKNS